MTKFWKSNKLEYFRQTHVLIITVIVFVAVVAAFTTGVIRIVSRNNLSQKPTYEACRNFIDDEALCKFAASNENAGKKEYVIHSTATNGPTSEITTIEVESSDKIKSTTLNGLTETEAFIVIDSKTYVKDKSDNTWAMYDDPDFQPSEETIKYDFTIETSADVQDFKNNYEYQSKEPCGDLTCYKYEVSGEEGQTNFIWFDDEEFLIRRQLTTTVEATTNSQFEYKDVIIQAPSPTKTVTEDQLEQYTAE